MTWETPTEATTYRQTHSINKSHVEEMCTHTHTHTHTHTIPVYLDPKSAPVNHLQAPLRSLFLFGQSDGMMWTMCEEGHSAACTIIWLRSWEFTERCISC